MGEIREICQHPNADTLSLCKVCIGENNVRQIVRGAKNFKSNEHATVALSGTVLLGDFTIGKSKLRGVDSDGMMCNGKELGIGNDHSELRILNKSTRIGACLHDEMHIDGDTIFDISLNANRGDCLSHIGIARDLAAKLNDGLELPGMGKAAVVAEERPQAHFFGKNSNYN
jgi:phenylalanyl-tRNA synthetase beta chain